MKSAARARRLTVCAEALGHPVPDRVDPESHVSSLLESTVTPRNVWLTVYILRGLMPTSLEMREALNALALEGAAQFVRNLADSVRPWDSTTVELVSGLVLVDVRHTAETDLATGIQRVARETAKRWSVRSEVALVTWNLNGGSMRRLSADERKIALHGGSTVAKVDRGLLTSILVPTSGTYILPELAAESWRTDRVAAMAEFSGLKTGVIGFDCVPLTTGETVGHGMPAAFARNLAAVAHMAIVATISDAARDEYNGWKTMLAATGLAGPTVVTVPLASHVEEVGHDAIVEFDAYLGDDLPLVLVVGSHEPRKNHVSVLRAAEHAWNRGLIFRLLFIGGNSWNGERFQSLTENMKDKGHPISTVSGLSDRLLYAAYRKARFTMFPSLNEGFGLPVAESLISGTPVITSNFGSMAQIVQSGGALTVDPRNQSALSAAMVSLLVDDGLLMSLREETGRFRARSWDEYADHAWRVFIE